MKKQVLGNGFKLLLISILYRVISFAVFSYSWQWNGVFARIVEGMIGILFFGIWFFYGAKVKLGFIRGLLVGFVGAVDAILLTLISLLLYWNRGSYYFGPIEMALWNIPLMGITNLIKVNTTVLFYLAPWFAILLTAVGSGIRRIKQQS